MTAPTLPRGAAGGAFRANAKIQGGTFNLNGFAGAVGMPAGNYKVGVVATQGRSESGLFGREIVLPAKGQSAFPVDRYADPKTSGLTAQVSKDRPNEPVIELK